MAEMIKKKNQGIYNHLIIHSCLKLLLISNVKIIVEN